MLILWMWFICSTLWEFFKLASVDKEENKVLWSYILESLAQAILFSLLW